MQALGLRGAPPKPTTPALTFGQMTLNQAPRNGCSSHLIFDTFIARIRS